MIERIAVVVPARDEEATLPACLEALAVAAARVAPPVSVVVVADVCRDRTAELALAAGARLVTSTAGSVGGARDLGVRAVLAATGAAGACWVACTDADSTVPGDWLEVHFAAAEAGVALLRGTVRPAVPRADLQAWSRRNPVAETHPYVHGANLGVRGDAYLTSGGFPHLSEHEDVALVAAVLAAGLPVDSTDRAPVLTSGRWSGRTPGGFAGYLRAGRSGALDPSA